MSDDETTTTTTTTDGAPVEVAPTDAPADVPTEGEATDAPTAEEVKPGDDIDAEFGDADEYPDLDRWSLLNSQAPRNGGGKPSLLTFALPVSGGTLYRVATHEQDPGQVVFAPDYLPWTPVEAREFMDASHASARDLNRQFHELARERAEWANCDPGRGHRKPTPKKGTPKKTAKRAKAS